MNAKSATSGFDVGGPGVIYMNDISTYGSDRICGTIPYIHGYIFSAAYFTACEENGCGAPQVKILPLGAGQYRVYVESYLDDDDIPIIKFTVDTPKIIQCLLWCVEHHIPLYNVKGKSIII
jgi:hypothetical protein